MSSHSAAPISASTAIQFSDPIPAEVDVVVIGGGVIGILTALYLNRLGLSAYVVEKGRVAGEQSSRNWGWIRQLGRDEAELPVMMESSRLWQQLDADTGKRTGFRRSGILYLASTQKELDKQEKWLEIGKRHQLDVTLLDAASVATRVGTGSGGRRWAGGLWSPGDGRAEPWLAVPAIARLAQSEGVGIRESSAARTIEMAAGKVSGVHTEHGFIAASQVIVAGGAWSSLLLKNLGISIPQLTVRSTVAQTAPMAEVFAGSAHDEELAFRRREDGGYTITSLDGHDLLIGPDAFRHLPRWLSVAMKSLGDTRFRPYAPKHYPDAWGTARQWSPNEQTPFERCRVLEPVPDQRCIERARQGFALRFPELGAPHILNAWAGMIDAMPDVVPVVDRVPSCEGLIVATGMSGHGFGIGPGFGKAIANLAAGHETGHDLTRFRFSRFTDGSRLVPGPSL
ncbi:NAD(P)/FAD-dependent oxidoreductase [Granulosicoccus antarcticus]|uniref:4-methylaminobutanoate oxidase (Formaldehyde-forming) n=1 Tax=Granulosicoccus antarcticus IMCC3135 TaxID=1192854 RepID=A0A2Z2NL28_9GAMM|nr:FAD-binding oxidoreductase [Granulosicoccus antarcticus]ASJ70701.1 4-methylaminobutanoate oxidase (formaldehyde-forming) [Granulosicoccus antarcticus IMCC3135]